MSAKTSNFTIKSLQPSLMPRKEDITKYLADKQRYAGEKTVMRAAFEAGYPLILLQENGFTDLAKSGGKRFDACAEGRMLILAPWEHHNERRTIRRDQCLTLNDMAAMICGGGGDGSCCVGAERCSAIADLRNTPSANDQCTTSANAPKP